jgi:hypothetical protein
LHNSYTTSLLLGFSARIISANYIGAFRKGLRLIYAILLIELISNWHLIDYFVEVLIDFYRKWNGLLNDRDLVQSLDFRIIRVELSDIDPWLIVVSSGITMIYLLRY